MKEKEIVAYQFFSGQDELEKSFRAYNYFSETLA